MHSDLPPESAPPANPQIQIQQLRTLRQAVVIGLVGFSLLSLILALFLISTTIRNDIERSTGNLTALQEQLIVLSTPSSEVQALRTTLTETVATANLLAAARPPAGIQWPAVVSVIGSYDQATIHLASLVQNEKRITLSGQAADDAAVVAYVRMLESSELFATVGLQSLLRPTPAPVVAGATPATTGPSQPSVEFVIILDLGVQPS